MQTMTGLIRSIATIAARPSAPETSRPDWSDGPLIWIAVTLGIIALAAAVALGLQGWGE